MLKLTNLLLIATATTTALVAGLFYSWSCSVTPGLSRLSNAEYIAAMQAMNRAILNPAFFICFLGTVALLPASAYVHYSQPASLRFWFLLAATAIYIVGVFGVTVAGNVPLNESLDAFSLSSASAEEMANRRAGFESLWNKLNMVRTVCAAVSIVCVIIACIARED